MNNLPRQKLCELIARFGTSLCDEPGRCEGYLRDYCPQHRREVNVLVTALKESVAADLLSVSESMPVEVVLGRLVKRLRDHHGTEEQTARWAVESWALALGKITKESLTHTAAAPATITPKQASTAVRSDRSAVPSISAPLKTASRPLRSFPFVFAILFLLLATGAGGAWYYFGVMVPKAEEVRKDKERLERLAEDAVTIRKDKEKADAEEKQKQMAVQLERERLLKEAERKKLAAANEFNTASIGDKRVVDLGSGAKLTLCYCPSGSFTMGSPAGEAGRFANEEQVPVKISRGYWLAQTECTQAQWRAVMGTEPSQFKGNDLPVELVSWEDAQEFMVKLNVRNVLPAGWQWSLPTEAQWEYACRAGTTTTFSFGDSLGSQQANFDGNSPYGGASKGPYLEKTSPVGSYAANAWGLQDMHGNVFEWCRDWGETKLPGGTDPRGASSGSSRVFRGGSWGDGGHGCRSAYRFALGPGDRLELVGFRVASVPVGAE